MHVEQHVKQHLRRGSGALRSGVVGLAVAGLATAAVGFAGPASASPVPPHASAAMIGTWVNVNHSTRSVTQLVVKPKHNGSVTVDAFGACHPTACEWGRVPAVVYGKTVSATRGRTFQTRQRFVSNGSEWSRRTLVGTVVRTRHGLRLKLQELTVFEDGSGRKNYVVRETFKKGRGVRGSHRGSSVSGYQLGEAPAMLSDMLGTWNNVSTGGALASIKIDGTPTSPSVEAFGRCSPTPCDWGVTYGNAFGPSISASKGATVFADYGFGFKRAQLIVRYSVVHDVPRLTVTELSEFTDGSGRANYAMTEVFEQA